MEENLKFLYHYTTIQTLHKLIDGITFQCSEEDKEQLNANSILRYYTMKFWGSQINYMNDPTENIYYVRCLKEAALDYTQSQMNRWKVEQIFLAKNFFEMGVDPYILSLSSAKQSLSMWRAYSDNAQGVAIGFSVANLMEFLNGEKNDQQIRLSPIKYFDQEELIGQFTQEQIGEIFSSISKSEPIRGYDSAVGFKNTIRKYVQPQTTFIKPRCYEDEKEWRLFTLQSHPSGFRERRGLIIPYYEFNIPMNLIDHILLGPCAEKTGNKDALEEFLHYKLPGSPSDAIPIQVSELPYRVR